MARADVATMLALIVLCASRIATAATGPLDAKLQLDVENARGVAFLRPPTLEVASGDAFDAARSALAVPPVPIECSTAGFRLRAIEGAFVDVERDRIVARDGTNPADIRVAAGHLLDAQRYPALVRDAATRSGDMGIAERALLAASACASAEGGLGERPEGDAGDLFADPVLELDGPSEGVVLLRTPILAASEFLRRQPDREAPFQRPPRSTAELVIPGRWENGAAPLELIGPAPSETGCEVTADASVGVFALVRAFFAVGGSVRRGAFVGWRGDRLVAMKCADDHAAWVYVAVFERPRDASDFARAADALLPPGLPRPFEVRAEAARVTAWHAIDAAPALRFGARLTTRPLR